MPLGLLLWFFTLESGIHAALTGVLLAVTIPSTIKLDSPNLVLLLEDRLRMFKEEPHGAPADPLTISSPAQQLEQRLHRLVAFGIIPLFAFANTSLALDASVLGKLAPPLGILAW